MEAVVHPSQDIEREEDKKKARIGAIIWLIVLLIMLAIPWMHYQDPPPGQEGILVNLGIPDIGEGDDNAAAASAEPDTSEPETPPEEPKVEPDPPPKEAPKVDDTKDVIENDAEAIALQKKKDKEKQKKAEEDRKKKAEADKKQKEEARKKKAKEEAEQKKREEEARKKAEADKLKNELGGLFGDGGGKGNTGTSGNQGDPNGDPNSDVLEGISTGAGKVGGGLGNRGGAGPPIVDSSQATGTVVVRVCVDDRGKVVSAKFTQKGSSTSNSRLIKLAQANAKKWSFKNGAIDKQCGTITYEFKVK